MTEAQDFFGVIRCKVDASFYRALLDFLWASDTELNLLRSVASLSSNISWQTVSNSTNLVFKQTPLFENI